MGSSLGDDLLLLGGPPAWAGLIGLGLLVALAANRHGTGSPLQEVTNLAAATYRRGRRVVIFVIGVTLLVVGAAMIVLPGPATVVIPLGLGLLAVEFAWARRWLRRLKRSAGQLHARMRDGTK